jgi:peptidoglycan/LPS O-acetylase OafA/YrhL
MKKSFFVFFQKEALSSSSENIPLTSVRGVAALGVFIAHIGVVFWRYMPRSVAIPMVCGWTGVDLFFVLSGFILASVYAGLLPATWPQFWRKRLLRVYPLNTALLLFLAAFALFGINPGVDVDWPDLPWHFLALQSFVPHHKPGWIFTNWSVGVEMICYLGFPLLILGLHRLNAAGLLIATTLAAALTFDMQLHAMASFWGGHAIMRCGSEFMLGASAGMLARRMPRLSPIAATGLEGAALLGIALGLRAGLSWDWCLALGSWRMACLPIATAVLITALASDSGVAARLLHAPVLHWLGRVSFSLYLIHEPLLRSLAPLLPLAGPRSLTTIAVWSVLSLALALFLSSLTYRFIEVPGRRLLHARRPPEFVGGGYDREARQGATLHPLEAGPPDLR